MTEFEEKMQDCIDEIMNTKFVAQRRGKWINRLELGLSGTKYISDNCSVCGCLAIDARSEKYCHNCGAIMDLEDIPDP